MELSPQVMAASEALAIARRMLVSLKAASVISDAVVFAGVPAKSELLVEAEVVAGVGAEAVAS